MIAVFKREFKSYFISPLGYAFLAIYLFVESSLFVQLFSYGSPNNELIFPYISTIVVFVTPVIKKFFREHYYQVTSDQKRVDAESHMPGPDWLE